MSSKPRVIGAAPAGAANERASARAVQQMFDEIAPRYDLLNHVLSCNVDRLWWWRTARKFRDVLQRADAHVLDLCCGTGDMSVALRKQMAGGTLIGADFSHQMLRGGLHKFTEHQIAPLEADALELPLPDTRFDLVTAAFGFRNLSNYDAGLREIYRVLKAGGEVGILDFSDPKGLFGRVYRFYFHRVLPKIGAMISRSSAYSYLPASVERFPDPQEMLERMRAAGFREVSWTPYSFGIAGLYRGRK